MWAAEFRWQQKGAEAELEHAVGCLLLAPFCWRELPIKHGTANDALAAARTQAAHTHKLQRQTGMSSCQQALTLLSTHCPCPQYADRAGELRSPWSHDDRH